MASDEKLIERLPGDLRDIADLCGLDAALKIAERYRSTYIYVPAIDREIRDQAIRDEYSRGDTTAKALALKYRLCLRRIWDILGTEPEEDETPTLPFK